MKSSRQFFRDFFSENGNGSSKRLIGSITMILVLICTIILVFKEGCTDNVESVLQTLIISSCGLLGLSSITSIWKHGSSTLNEVKNERNNN